MFGPAFQQEAALIPIEKLDTQKGKKLKYLRTLLAFVGFVGLGGIAQARVRDEIVVTLPFDFVARGETAHGVYTFSISRTTIMEASKT